jgi:predicted amidohydrolase YtcJ
MRRQAHRRRLVPILFSLFAGLFAGCSAWKPADLVLVGGTVVTVDARRPTVEAVAAREGRIVALGSDAEIRELVGPQTVVIELGGAVAYPGFIDGHAHFLGIGKTKMALDLRGTASWDEIVDKVRAAVAVTEPGQWIRGRGWHQERWTETPQPNVDGLPFHDELSRASPDNPVVLTHASGHAAIANARALEMAGIDARTPDPPGGKILRDRSGRPTGVLLEDAEELVTDLIDRIGSRQLFRRRVELATRECLSKGVTSFQDAGSRFDEVDLLREMAEAGELEIRLWVMLLESNQALAQRAVDYRLVRAGNGFLSVGGIKRYMDGALGSHGAWLLEPYADMPTSTGIPADPLDVISETAQIALEHGFQLCIHAIGDRANREVLDLYAEVFRDRPKHRDLRWRIEHTQHLHPDDVPRFAELGVIASMQPTHCTSDGPWVVERLGEARAEEGAYVWRSLLDAGTIISCGTDAPVEDPNPIATFYSAVTRRMGDGRQFYPEQCMTRHEALEAMTIRAAYAAFEETQKGSLELGKYADLTVLDRDLLTAPEEEIPEARVLYTIVGGEVKYRAE